MATDDKLIQELLDLTDDVGILSFYVGMTPEEAMPQPKWPIELRNAMRDLREGLATADHGARAVIEKRLDSLEPRLHDLMDPSAHGRGRALFVRISDGSTVETHSQLPFRTRAVLGERAVVHPIVVARAVGRPAGLVAARRDSVTVVHWADGHADEVLQRTFIAPTVEESQKLGPSGDNPALGMQGQVHEERYLAHVDANRERFLRTVAGEIADCAKSRNWERVVVAGPADIRRSIMQELPDRLRLVDVDRVPEATTPPELADEVWHALRDDREAANAALVEAVEADAAADGQVALGLAAVTNALNEARVQHLVLDAEAEASGFRTSEGQLFAYPDNDAGDVGYEVHEEPRLVERMVQRAFETGASVTPVDGGAAERLRRHDGVAARLRW